MYSAVEGFLRGQGNVGPNTGTQPKGGGGMLPDTPRYLNHFTQPPGWRNGCVQHHGIGGSPLKALIGIFHSSPVGVCTLAIHTNHQSVLVRWQRGTRVYIVYDPNGPSTAYDSPSGQTVVQWLQPSHCVPPDWQPIGSRYAGVARLSKRGRRLDGDITVCASVLLLVLALWLNTLNLHLLDSTLCRVLLLTTKAVDVEGTKAALLLWFYWFVYSQTRKDALRVMDLLAESGDAGRQVCATNTGTGGHCPKWSHRGSTMCYRHTQQVLASQPPVTKSTPRLQ